MPPKAAFNQGLMKGNLVPAEKKNFLWCLYNGDEKELLSGLIREEVCCLLSRLPNEDRLYWLVWREDWSEWQVATLLPELFVMHPRPMPVAHPPVPSDSSEDEALIEIKKLYQSNQVGDESSANAEVVAVGDIPDLTIETEGAEFVPRAHLRLRRRYDIIIDSNGKQFKTSSVDVSVGGILLADPLPQWVFGYCTITIVKSNKKESVQLTCSIVENQPPQRRYRVALSPLKRTEDQVRLHQWLSSRD